MAAVLQTDFVGKTDVETGGAYDVVYELAYLVHVLLAVTLVVGQKAAVVVAHKRHA